jgi:hypothetical protein
VSENSLTVLIDNIDDDVDAHHRRNATCRQFLGNELANVSAEIRFLNTSRRWMLKKRVRAYANGNSRLLETRSLLRVSSKHFLGYTQSTNIFHGYR